MRAGVIWTHDIIALGTLGILKFLTAPLDLVDYYIVFTSDIEVMEVCLSGYKISKSNSNGFSWK